MIDIYGSIWKAPHKVNRSKFTEREASNEQHTEFKSYEVGMQISFWSGSHIFEKSFGSWHTQKQLSAKNRKLRNKTINPQYSDTI